MVDSAALFSRRLVHLIDYCMVLIAVIFDTIERVTEHFSCDSCLMSFHCPSRMEELVPEMTYYVGWDV